MDDGTNSPHNDEWKRSPYIAKTLRFPLRHVPTFPKRKTVSSNGTETSNGDIAERQNMHDATQKVASVLIGVRSGAPSLCEPQRRRSYSSRRSSSAT